jgi:plastocyanin
MRFLTFGGVIVLTLMVGLIAMVRATADPAIQNTITIEDYAFKPPSITIAAGTTVVWKNLDDDPHTVTAVDGSFDSHGLAQGDTFSYSFAKPGKYQYYCKIHPMMRGSVIVTERNS